MPGIFYYRFISDTNAKIIFTDIRINPDYPESKKR
jgi:hypothetical protein